MSSLRVAAVDLGATSGRVMVAEVGTDRLDVHEVHRFANGGVPEEELGAYYAQRTLLKREVLPEHVANAVFALTGGDLTHTTGLHIPVDAGVAAAFLR